MNQPERDLHEHDANERDIAHVVARFAPVAERAGACPDPNLLAGYAEHRLAEEERTAVEAHLADCDACRSLIAVVGGAATPVRSRTRRARWWIAAAAAVLAVGTVFWLERQWTGTAPEPGTDGRLVAAAERLERAHPEWFRGFRPLDRPARLASGTTAERGGPVLLAPCETVLSARPTFRWQAVAGAVGYEIALATGAGAPLWQRSAEATELAFPADQPELAPGKYLWRLTAHGPLGPELAGRTFVVAGAGVRAAWLGATRAIESECPRDLGALLRAHYALRADLVAEGVAAAQAALDAAPADPVARETLYRALVAAGDEAAAARVRP